MKLGFEHKTTIKAYARPTHADLEWCAAFLEGEGSFKRDQRSHHVRATQKDPEPLYRLQAFLGGSIRPSWNQHGSDYWVWGVSGSRARGVMLTLYRLMHSRRRAQIRIALRPWEPKSS